MKLQKQIRGYEGLYEVRSDGAIVSISREKKLPNGKLCQSKERVMSPARIGTRFAFRRRRMKLTIKAEGINDEAIKVLTKAVKRLYKPYVEHYIGCESFELKIGGEE